ncbi:histone-like nucleoid-structuring protein Lsr2 [Streptomyces sp. NPDC048248]|uniref:Lsr2 family DNA-binding protein n=1 Tax=Streptomyces sp. NPDC048248 TaxID=3365523 RepID=UPI00371A0BA9
MNDLERLKELCPPPPGHTPPTVNWHDTEQALGHPLPDDYKHLVETYGPGHFVQFLSLYQPKCPYHALDLERQTRDVNAQLTRHQEVSQQPLPHPPRELQPVGGTDNGDYLFWLKNDPEQPNGWTIAVTGLKDGDWSHFDGNLTAFLVALSQHDTDVSAFPDSLLRQSPSFTPYTTAPEEIEKANRHSNTATAAPVQSQDVRQWARENGYDVPERGRIPADVRKAYDAAHN